MYPLPRKAISSVPKLANRTPLALVIDSLLVRTANYARPRYARSGAPERPACPSRASGWSSLTTPWGFPCCVRFPCVHAAATTPAQRLDLFFAHPFQPYQPSPIGLSGRPAHRPFRGLLGVHSRCGLHTRAVTKFVTAIRGLQTFRHLHACPGCFRLERSPGGPCTHWKSAALSRRTRNAAVGHTNGR